MVFNTVSSSVDVKKECVLQDKIRQKKYLFAETFYILTESQLVTRNVRQRMVFQSCRKYSTELDGRLLSLANKVNVQRHPQQFFSL